MNLLVTGAAGFIGSNMVQYLLENTDHLIYGIDNFRAGERNKEFLKKLECERFIFIEDDFSKIENIFNNIQLDIIYHFAATPRISYSVEHPIETNNNNITNSLVLLEFCRKNSVKRFVFSSSSSVYGDALNFPTVEESKKSPNSPYALQKSVMEDYCKIYSSLYDIDTVCLRYFSVYGPRQYPENSYSTVVCSWLHGFINNTEIRLDGDGSQSRDFSYVMDVCKANYLVGEMNKKFNGDIFNVACDNSTSLMEIFEMMKEVTGNCPKINQCIIRKGDMKKTHADISKIRSIGFNPDVSIKEGISLTYKWYINQINEK
jgi:nucleoside-diphosphate-sugar epimerase